MIFKELFWHQFSPVQSLSHVRLFEIPWTTAHQASPSITNSWSSLRLMSIESVTPSSHIILCRPLHLLPPIPPSIRVFPMCLHLLNNLTLRLVLWDRFYYYDLHFTDEYTGALRSNLLKIPKLKSEGLKSMLIRSACYCCCSVTSVVSDSFVTLWTEIHQAPLSTGFSWKE